MQKKKYPKNKNECVVCRVEFDNWITNQEYSSEQEEIARNNFCRYCPFCNECEKKGRLIKLKD